VTVLTPFPLDPPMANYRDIVTPIDDDYKQLMQKFTQQQTQSHWERFKAMNAFFYGSLGFSNNSIHQPAFKKVMNEETFDLIIIPFFFNDFQVGKSFKFLISNDSIFYKMLCSRFGCPF
jgi:glucuronosyltransferase